jgi:XTP/dITP diphosphohydrolase
VTPRILYVASSNAGKLRDFAVAAETHDIEIRPLPGLDSIEAPDEDQPDFAGNARLKAVYYSRFAPGAIVLADDSGLEVDALGGEPGVHSARYAARATGVEPEGGQKDAANNALLLANMKAIPAGRRSARYHCVLAAARDGQVLVTTDGSVEGEILFAPRGTGGFGYDPLFYIPALERSMAEIDLETKYELSHRGRAFRALLDAMETHPL